MIRLRFLSLFLLVLSVFGLMPTAAYAKTEELNLSVGEEVTLDNVLQFSVENQQVLSATAGDGKSVVLRGLRSGNSKILLRGDGRSDTRTIDVTVSARDPKLVMADLDSLLRNYTDITLRVSRNLVIMDGSVKTERELAQIREIEKRFEGQVSNLVSVGPTGQRRNVMVRLDLHYVQVRRRLQRSFGLNYPAQIKTGTILHFALNGIDPTSLASAMPTGGTGGMPVTQQPVFGDLLPSLDLSETNGFIKLMRTDTLLTQNGIKAIYRNGAEAFVKLTGALSGGSLERVFYGAQLTVTPRLSASNDAVSLELAADLSQRDVVNTDGIPGRIVDQLETNVHIPIGQSIMLAGLELQAMARSTSGIPWLNRIPILGYLFGSENKDAESGYGVVYITPTLVQEAGALTQSRIDTALKYFEKPESLKR